MDSLTPEILIIRLLSIVQSVLALYLFFVSFYGKRGSCWDRVGFWVHTIVAIIVFFMIPVAIITLKVKLSLNISDYIEVSAAPTLFTVAMLNFGILIYGATAVRSALMSTYRWRKER